MSAHKPLAAVVGACRDLLAEAGFKKRGGEVFTVDVVEDVLGWLGLNRAVGRSGDVVEINPVVGVRHQAVERMLAELRGEKFHAYAPPTISVHVGYLMPDKRYTPCLFDSSNISATAESMVDAIVTYGVPFMRQHETLETLLSLMNAGDMGVREQLAYRVPIAWHLLGEDERAAEGLAVAVRDLGDRGDLAAQRFRVFVGAFEERTGVTVLRAGR